MGNAFRDTDLMTVLEGVSDGVLKLDRQANYMALNRAAVDIFKQLGRNPDEVIGKCVWEVFPEAAGTIVERELRKALNELVHTSYEFYLSPAKRWYESSVYPSKDGAILVFRDITKLKSDESSVGESKNN